jgi:hypothetical protein
VVGTGTTWRTPECSRSISTTRRRTRTRTWVVGVLDSGATAPEASTSQILANLALNPLDHYARRELGIDTYLRYCDDMVAVFEDRDQAVEALTGIGHRLNSLGLALNPCSHIGPCSAGIDWVGYRHWSGYRLIRKSTIRRIRKKLRAGPLDHDSLMSYLSHGLRTASLDHLCRLCSFCRAYSISRWLKAR